MDNAFPASHRPRMTAEQKSLAARYVPFARALARPLRIAHPGIGDELESAAMLALSYAAVTFDPKRNVPFSSYAGHRIKGALHDVQRASGGQRRRSRNGSEHSPQIVRLSLSSELRGLVLNTNVDAPVGAEIEAIEEVENCLRKLPPRHARACRYLYLYGKDQGEVAELLGCSRSRLSAINREALSVLYRWHTAHSQSLHSAINKII
jgi:RNA polymerase sigma factor (sigma-70 family)